MDYFIIFCLFALNVIFFILKIKEIKADYEEQVFRLKKKYSACEESLYSSEKRFAEREKAILSGVRKTIDDSIAFNEILKLEYGNFGNIGLEERTKHKIEILRWIREDLL